MRKLNKLHMMVQTGEKPDGEKIYERDEVKLGWNVLHDEGEIPISGFRIKYNPETKSLDFLYVGEE